MVFSLGRLSGFRTSIHFSEGTQGSGIANERNPRFSEDRRKALGSALPLLAYNTVEKVKGRGMVRVLQLLSISAGRGGSFAL